MAEKQDTTAARSRKATDHDGIDRLRGEQRARREALQAEKAASARRLGAVVVAGVVRRLEARDALFTAPLAGMREVKPSRPRTWRGPHSGRKYANAADLERATIEDCRAGFKATWGHEFTSTDRDVYLLANDSAADMRNEREAGAIYDELRAAIARLEEFAKRTRVDGAASAAVHEMWGLLPSLPPRSELPGYESKRADRRMLAETWQEDARQRLGSELSPRELAELSILVGLGPGRPFAQYLQTRNEVALGVSPSTVIDDEAKRFPRSRARYPGR